MSFPTLKLLGLCAAAWLQAGIASADAATPRLEIIGTNSGQATSAQIKTHDGTTFVTGSVYRRTTWTSPHVHIVLVDKNGQALVSQWVDLIGWKGNPATNSRGTYTASFAPAEIARAATVQVTFQNGLHTFCATEQPPACGKG